VLESAADTKQERIDHSDKRSSIIDDCPTLHYGHSMETTALISIPDRELVNINELKTDQDNPNRMTKEQHERLATSIQKYGFIVPIITNKDLLIADGEQRLTVAKSLQMTTVPIIRLPVEDVDRRLLRQVLNKLRGEHDLTADALEFEKIISLGREDDLKHLLDLSDNGLEKYLREIREVKDENYEVPEIDKIETNIKRGDIIQLGKHRLYCGDATCKEDVEKLMDDNKANMLMTDPPYGVDYQSKEEYLRTIDKGTYTHGRYANDEIDNYNSFTVKWLSNLPLTDYNTTYIWCNGWHLKEIMVASESEGIILNHPLIWVKNTVVLARTDYYPKHEICLYGWKGKHRFYGKRRANVLEFNKPNRSLSHPTMKPVEMIAELLLDGCQQNEAVLDLFGGSGSTLIACEQTCRTCYMMEIDPRYCQVIVDRWQKYTGQKAEKILRIEA